jgi:hypothetical protein
MQSVSIELPAELVERAKARAIEHGFVTADAYIAALVEADAASAHAPARSDVEVEALLLERENDDRLIEATPEFWKSLREEAGRRATQAASRP